MHANILSTLDSMSVFHRRGKAPAAQRLKQELIESRIRRGLDEVDIERAIRVDEKARDGNELIALLAQIVGECR